MSPAASQKAVLVEGKTAPRATAAANRVATASASSSGETASRRGSGMGRLGKTELQRVMVESAPEVAAAIVDAVNKVLMITTCGSSNNIDNRTIISTQVIYKVYHFN